MKWSFPHNNDGDVNGINNSGIETFLGTPIKSLAREICQNTIDSPAEKDVAVELEFKTFVLEPEEIPDTESLEKAFVAAYNFWEPQSSKKAKDFFIKATNILRSGSIPFLRISDFNTTGLLGSEKEYNTPWCNLTKSSGASDKAGTAGGSFGIGKFAPFACSDFRTVFYSTLDVEGCSAYQGISRITSFRREQDSKLTVGVGYYGSNGHKPVYEQLKLDPNFMRTSTMTGTDIFIAAFNRFSDWKSDIIASILDGFLVSVYKEKLIVRVDDVEICKDTLPFLLEEYKEHISENAGKYYTVLTSNETKWYPTNFRNLGTISLGLMIQADMHRKVAMVRKAGMKIMDKGNISGIIPFAGVMLIEGDEINKFLQKMENPQHTKWEPDRADNRIAAQEFVRGLTKYIIECLDDLKKDDAIEEIDPSVGEYLPHDTEATDKPDTQPTEVIPDAIKTIEKTVVTKKPALSDMAKRGTGTSVVDENGDIDDEDIQAGTGHKRGNGGGGNGHGNKDGKGTGSNLRQIRKVLTDITPTKIRAVCLNKNKGEYSITFVPSISAVEGWLELFLSAESGSYVATIKNVIGIGQSGLVIEGNKIKNLNFKANEAVRLRISLDYYELCSMEVKAYGNKI
jgi:hypothetical protein